MQTFDIWSFQLSLTRRLMVWSIASIVVGIVFLFFGTLWRGIGTQFIAWGGIDLLIAIAGRIGTDKRKSRLSLDELTASAPKECANLKRILLINTVLDVLYVCGGLALILTLGATDVFWYGNGMGIILQGGFLFIFDLYHALKLR